MSNKVFFDRLMDQNAIRIRRGALFDFSPKPKSADFDFRRAEGMLLELAIGDALGNTTESLMPDERAIFGEIRDYAAGTSTGSA